MRNRCHMTGLLIVLAVILSPAVSSYADSPFSIVPGRSVGSISIGQNFSEIQKTLGIPDMKKEVQNAYLVKYVKKGIVIQYHSFSGQIQFAGITGAEGKAYKTKDGLSTGSTKSQVEALYSKPKEMIPVTNHEFYPQSQEMALYVASGIAFHYDSKGTVVVIIIFDPRLYGG